MKLDIRGRQRALTATLRAHIERRLLFSLRRFDARIVTVSATVEDLNGPRGGRDKQCRLIATLEAGGHAQVEVRDSNVTSAVNRAADQLKRTVARQFDRWRPYPRYRPSLSALWVNGVATSGSDNGLRKNCVVTQSRSAKKKLTR